MSATVWAAAQGWVRNLGPAQQEGVRLPPDALYRILRLAARPMPLWVPELRPAWLADVESA